MFRLLACLALTVLAAAGATAKPIDFTDRALVVRPDPAKARAAGEATIEFTLQDGLLKEAYGLLVPSTAEPAVKVNGRTLDINPLLRSEGFVYYVPRGYLKPGANCIDIVAEPFPVGKEVTETQPVFFALDGSYEEVHFNRAFVPTAAGVRAQPPTDPRQAWYDVLWYDCAWTPSMTSTFLNAAQVTMGARSLNSSLQVVVLDFDSNGGALAVSTVDSGPSTPALPYTLDTVNNRLLITLPATVPSGQTFQVRVIYSGAPDTVNYTFSPALWRDVHGPSSTAVVFSFSEPYGARQWWPCKDLPDDKPTTTVQRVTVPAGAGWQVVSNGKLTSKTSGGGNETWVWTNSFPIATYLVSICISNYAYSSATYTALDGLTTMAISHAIFPENTGTEGSAAAGTLQVMNYFAQKFGEYPFLSEKYFTASHTDGAGMEHQTCTSMPGNETDGVGVSDGYNRRNVHELAHQWFGDLITCRTFDHLWLNEGFATYCEALFYEFQKGVQEFHRYVNAWTVSTTTPVVGPNSDSFSGSVVYRKGAWVLHMLRHVVGDSTFTEVLRQWVVNPTTQYGTAVSADFEAVAEAISGRDLTTFFSQWLYRPDGVSASQPTYRFNGGSTRTGADFTVNFSVAQTQAGTPYVMPLDVEVVDANGAGSVQVVQNTVASQSFSLSMGTTIPVEADLDPDNWVLKSANAFSVNTVGLGRATVNQAFRYQLHATGATTPYTWSSAAMPPGLALASGGLITGTPTTVGTYSVPYSVTDSAAANRTGSLTFEVVAAGTLPAEVIVESRTTAAGTTAAPGYAETGAFSNTTSKSSAPRAVGAGARYSTAIGASAAFRPAIPAAGLYDVFVTLDDRYFGSNNNARANFAIQHDGANINGSVYLNPYTPGLRNKWLRIASRVQFAAGAAGSAGAVILTNVDGNASTGARFTADAVRFVYVDAVPVGVTGWEVY
jgi:hypothetical protein